MVSCRNAPAVFSDHMAELTPLSQDLHWGNVEAGVLLSQACFLSGPVGPGQQVKESI